MTDRTTVDGRAEPEATPARQRRRRGRGRLVAGLLIAVAAAGGGFVAVNSTGLLEGGAGPTRSASALPPATATVSRQTLNDTRDADGELGYGPVTTAVSRAPGTITWLPESGATVTRGKSLYRLDNDPVTLMYGDTPAYRDLKIGTEGKDVENLERNLDKLGYDGFTVDDEFTYDTYEAVLEWQEDRGLDETGVVKLGQVVFADGKVRVESVEAEEGQPAQPGQKVLTYTGTSKVITVQLEAEDQRMARKGAKVEVTLPDGKSVKGKVTEVATVIVPGEGQEEPDTRVEALVSIGSAKSAKGLDKASVDVTFTASQRKNVLTVPVAALVALQEGGFGLEVVEGGGSRYVAVETGLFAGGKVEVSGDGLSEGMTVGMPK
ncbi:peptidoglycan hydrolase-like protein with peptidoglycan-binding domain [Nonomuraea thailandensis]|uniref:Peptidoglycan hydrolase-like protein with peptidoglycan-binding domain n=1 Tax=Nonomuraea thailandensis TaxID=1188745 RepID=A0A9X2GWW1_9ACTN|nr:peptidoglycan-binding protein [Nonomuraea thailandensis]MCP2365147.1 peptidoglycan hydrolase-like protein with peptidoglycan-binding domain [Nonomuraea thailandensis]